MTNGPGNEVLFLPWLGLGQEAKVGPFSFAPWSNMNVSDAGLRDHLETYFNRHVDHFGKPVSTVTIVKHKDHEFEPAPYQSHERPIDATYVLLFAVIGPTVAAAVSGNNRTTTPPTSDRFDLIQQNFRVGDDDVKVRVGSSLHAARISALMFPEPWDVGGSGCFPDDDLLAGFGTFFDSAFSAAVRDRIFRSLEWFRLAHIGGETVSEFSKLVMMATAFEILLKIPDGPGKTQTFIKSIEKHVVRPQTTNDCRSVTVMAGKKKGTKKFVTRSLPGWWADSFYNLRSRVVHGDSIPMEQLRYKDWISHLIVADVVFWQCIKSELYQLGFIGISIHAMKSDPAQAAMVDMLERQLLGFDAHKTLGWIV